MSLRVASLWRHPIKSHGREQVASVTLTAGKAMPFDRHWAVAHNRSRYNDAAPGWTPCGQFSRGAKLPQLQAISAQTDEETGVLTLTHPALPPLTFSPSDAAGARDFIEWLSGICGDGPMQPDRLIQAPGVAMTDTDYPSVSIANLSSHAAVEAGLQRQISPLRWRANILIDGMAPWAERDLIGQTIRIGDAELELRENITRCAATKASIRTGERDADTLTTLRDLLGAQEFAVYAVVTKGGSIAQGDVIEVL